MVQVNKIPFRRMRLDLKTAQAEVGLLLAVEHIDWPQNDYAFFFIMNEMWKKTDNPTYPQMIGMVGAWLRFYKRLIDSLPEDNPLRQDASASWQFISAAYQDVLEVKA